MPVSACMVSPSVDVGAGKGKEAQWAQRPYETGNGENIGLQELGVIMHNLKNPLAAIASIVDLLKASQGDEKFMRRDYPELLEAIDSAARQGLEEVQQLLDLIHLNGTSAAGAVVPLTSSFSVQELLEPVIRRFTMVARHKRLSFATHQLPAGRIQTSRRHFHAILDNLLSNACKFSPSGSTVELQCRRAGEHLVVKVCDEGPGIKEEERARLFTRYSHLGAAPQHGEHSSGLGLSITHRYVSLLGGKISCHNRKNGGCCFTVRLKAFPTSKCIAEP